MDKYKITLSSELGTEDFEYSNRVQANEGFDRLVKSCKKHYKQDKIVRHLALISVSREATIGEESPEDDGIDTSHLDARGWSLLSTSKKAEKAAGEMAEALDSAARAMLDQNMTVEDVMSEYMEDLMEKYADLGANDTEPRAIAKRFLNDILKGSEA